MFIKRNHTTIAGKQYQSVLLVQGKRVPGKRRPGRPKAQAPPPKSVVVHETLANLSKLPEELINLIEAYCKRKSAAALLAKEGITVNATAPALIATDMTTVNPKARPDLIPVGRMGTVEKTAQVVVMLASNGYITGQTISVNGGWYMS